MRRRAGVDHAVVMPKIATINSADGFSSLFAVYQELRLGAGTHTASAATSVLADKTLTAAGTALSATLILTSASTANDVVIARSGSMVSNLVINANLAARISGGFASYTHGVRSTDRANVTITGNEILAGEAPAFGNLFACGIYIERDLSATFDFANVVVTGNYINDHAYLLPFGIRGLTTITEGQARGAQGYNLTNVTVSDNTFYGTIKNIIELAGPDTTNLTVERNIGEAPLGQGGMEIDFGAAFNIAFSDNEIFNVGRDGVQETSFDAYSVRCGKYGNGNPGVKPDGVTMTGNVLRDSVQVGAHYLRVCNSYGDANTTWSGITASNLTKAVGATANRIIGLVIEPELLSVTGMTLTAPDMDGVEGLCLLSQNNLGFSGLTFNVTAAQQSRILSETPALSGQTFNII